MEKKKYTIKDIARMAGVSPGTVDRVMHNRGDVSEKSRLKVQNVLDEIDYQPNVFAIGLAAKRNYRIVCLLPASQKHNYWEAITKGIDRAAAELQAFNVWVEYSFYNHVDLSSYKECCSRLLEETVDGVLIAPNFHEETLRFTTSLDLRNIPYVFIDVNVESAHALSYIGQNSQVSGYIAAKMLMRGYEKGQELVLFLSEQRSVSSEIQMQRRMSGFMEYLHANCLEVPMHELVLQNDDIVSNRKILEIFFDTHPNAVLGFVLNSRVYQVAAYLHENSRKLKGLVGYDLLEKNVRFLQSGEIDWLIGQRPALQGYCGVKALSDHFVFKRRVDPIQYVPVDILMKENVCYQFNLDNY